MLVMLLLGITTMGIAYSDHLAVSNAVREGARLGAALNVDPANSSGWADSVQTRVVQTYFNPGSFNTPQVCVQLTDSTGSTVYSSPSSGNQTGTCGTTVPATPSGVTAGTCLVKVWAKNPESVTLGVLPNLDFSVGAQSVAYYGRTAGSCKSS
jgi:hypothetical protein